MTPLLALLLLLPTMVFGAEESLRSLVSNRIAGAEESMPYPTYTLYDPPVVYAIISSTIPQQFSIEGDVDTKTSGLTKNSLAFSHFILELQGDSETSMVSGTGARVVAKTFPVVHLERSYSIYSKNTAST